MARASARAWSRRRRATAHVRFAHEQPRNPSFGEGDALAYDALGYHFSRGSPMSFDLSRRALVAAALCSVAAATPAVAAGPTLLNVSYDVAREFYKDYNKAFLAYWKKTTGEDLTINQSHGGSSKQIRSVIATVFPEAVTLVREAREGLR